MHNAKICWDDERHQWVQRWCSKTFQPNFSRMLRPGIELLQTFCGMADGSCPTGHRIRFEVSTLTWWPMDFAKPGAAESRTQHWIANILFEEMSQEIGLTRQVRWSWTYLNLLSRHLWKRLLYANKAASASQHHQSAIGVLQSIVAPPHLSDSQK